MSAFSKDLCIVVFMCSAHPTIGPYICFTWRSRVGSRKEYSELVDDSLHPEGLNYQLADFRRCFSFLPSVPHPCSVVACGPLLLVHASSPSSRHACAAPQFQLSTCYLCIQNKNQTIGWSLFPLSLAQTPSIRDTTQVLQLSGLYPLPGKER